MKVHSRRCFKQDMIRIMLDCRGGARCGHGTSRLGVGFLSGKSLSQGMIFRTVSTAECADILILNGDTARRRRGLSQPAR